MIHSYKDFFLCLENEGNCIDHLITRDMPMPTDVQIEELFTKCQEKGMELEEIPIFKTMDQ